MIITQMLGPAQVVIFAVTYKVVALPVDLVYMGTVPFMAAFGEAKARHDWNWIKGAYRNGTLASIGLCLPLAVPRRDFGPTGSCRLGRGFPVDLARFAERISDRLVISV